MVYPRLALTTFVLVGFVASLQAQEKAATQSKPADLSILKGKADAIVGLGTVSARPRVQYVFDYADALASADRQKEAIEYYEKGLKIQSWALKYQLRYAQLLMQQGSKDQAMERARIVADNAERDDLVIPALKLLGKDADASIPKLEKPPGEGTTVVLLTVGDFDPLLIKEVQKKVQSHFSFPVILQAGAVKLPPPSRNPYKEYLDGLRKSLDRNPTSKQQALAQFKMKEQDLKDDDKLITFMKALMLTVKGKDAADQFADSAEAMKSTDKQWNADEMVTAVRASIGEVYRPKVRYLGIMRNDLGASGASFIFAQQAAPYGIVSYRRFKCDMWGDEVPKRTRLIERTAKQCTCSIGRIFGIDPCTTPSCVAAYPNSVEELDAKGGDFCQACKKKLDQAIAQDK